MNLGSLKANSTSVSDSIPPLTLDYFQVLKLYDDLIYYESLENRLYLIDSISTLLDIDLRNGVKLDSILWSIKDKNSELLEMETNLRKKLKASDLKVENLTNNLEIEKWYHDRTTKRLNKKIEEVDVLNGEIQKIKKRNRNWMVVLGSVTASVLGTIIITSVLN